MPSIAGEAPKPRNLRVVVTSLPSDAHTWNLIFLQKYIEECGHSVINLGSCVPAEELACACIRYIPDLVVISSVNGHGVDDGLRVITYLRAVPELSGIPIAIGGKLSTTGQVSIEQMERLVAAGFDAVFGEASLPGLRLLLNSGRYSRRAIRHLSRRT
jgi:methylaspartate mutase sigma subunit